ncbi:hypothetical protein B0J14DRAFT_296050 [Halenospora varia]|nr:hypothetical protein B0J14DRAFT_296050 [Halenospora varia]
MMILFSAPVRVSLLLIGLLAQASDSQTTNATVQASPYTHFDLFKNTQLQPCPVNNTKRKAAPRLDYLVVYKDAKVKSADDYCQYMAGTPIIIPTVPNKAAFYPSWPSFAIQLVSLMFTYLGLWNTLRVLNKNSEKQDMPLPKTFWVQLPIDIARILAWYITFFRGLADLASFPWVSTVIWTVPFNYIWLLLLIQGPKPEENTTPAFYPQRKSRSVLMKTIIGITMAVAVAQWAFSLAAVIIHYQYNIGAFAAKLYNPFPEVLLNPASLGPMPSACLSYLTSNKLPDELFTSIAALSAFSTQAFQLGATTLVCLIGIKRIMKNDYRRTYTMLRNSATGTQTALAFSALGLVGYAWGVGKVTIYLTNDFTITGPCTLATVRMSDLWGFYDVQYGRTFRIVLNALGV